MKTVVITGATKGIGLATSLKLADLGYNVVGIARNSPSNYPGEFFQCNLESIEATTITQINQHFKVDAIVNNVGIVLPEPLEKVTLDNLNKAYDLNVRAAVQVAQAFTPNMKANHYGKIVNISSRAIFGVKNRSSYAAAKRAPSESKCNKISFLESYVWVLVLMYNFVCLTGVFYGLYSFN